MALACLASADAGQLYRTGTELVTVPVSITDRTGKQWASPLSADDLRVFEDGVEQPITLFNTAREPTSLCIVLDTSGSMRGKRRPMSLALVEQTIAALSPDDEVSVVTFARDAHVLLAWTAPLPFPSLDWDKLTPVGPTALVAGVRDALPMLDTASRRRRAMLVISDGEENDSAVSVARLATTRRQREALVYGFTTAVRIDDRDRGVDGVGYMRAIIGDSGGYAEPIRVPSDVPAAVSRLAIELSQQITIGYVFARPPDGRYRRIKVEHRDKSLRLRHRAGYIASPSR